MFGAANTQAPDRESPSGSVTAVEGVLTRYASSLSTLNNIVMEPGTDRPVSIASSNSAALWQDDLAHSFSQLAASLRNAPAASAAAFEELAARVLALENAHVQALPETLLARLAALETSNAQLTATVENLQRPSSDTSEEFTKLLDAFKLEQLRLPMRLHNASVSKSAGAIRPLPIGLNGKTPSNFPNTKGEFEHITRERYADMLKAYGLSTAGEKDERRERLREFLGLGPPV